jgi:sarcosine oxidase delta subunit
MITCPHCGKEFKSENQAKGGRKSKRTISPEDQAKLQEARRIAREKKKEKK